MLLQCRLAWNDSILICYCYEALTCIDSDIQQMVFSKICNIIEEVEQEPNLHRDSILRIAAEASRAALSCDLKKCNN